MTNLTTSCIREPDSADPVTVTISRKVKPGCEAEYEQYISKLIKAASGFSGHQGATILRPSSATDHKYVTIYRFDSYDHCQQWERSDTRRQLIGKLASLSDGDASTQKAPGLEYWHTLPELPITRAPHPYKLAFVLICIVYVLVMGLNILLQPLLGSLPGPLRIFIVCIMQVLLMTFVIMPKVTQLLKGWLCKESGAG